MQNLQDEQMINWCSHLMSKLVEMIQLFLTPGICINILNEDVATAFHFIVILISIFELV